MSEPTLIRTYFRTVEVDGNKVFVREAGDPSNTTILMLHGFPGSSFQYRDLIPLLADRYHVIAPDMLGFGFSDSPPPGDYEYTFDNNMRTTDRLTQVMGVERYVLLVCDYGAPVGFRLALAYPDRVMAIISQNGNAYEDAIVDPDWDAWKEAWKNPSEEHREATRSYFGFDYTKYQFEAGVPDPSRIAPETYTLAFAAQSRPGNDEIQLDLIQDFGSELTYYPRYQEYFRSHQPPLLAVWGKHDPFFVREGAEAFKRDLPNAEVHLYDTSHFALETHANEIAIDIRDFLARTLSPSLQTTA
jgi:pimeloyl-ACP methyl ester carboxylesterase